MKLLKTDTTNLQLFEYSGAELSQISYAILSHTWEDEEILFTDIGVNGIEAKKGYRKVECARELARRDGYNFIWIDTCCIDKRSSAELSEAINSMYSWYENAAICYVYLSDVYKVISGAVDLTSDFARSRWFTRGWTLQELIAPRLLEFYSPDWKLLGTKRYVYPAIEAITGIDASILKGSASIERFSIARRMSWAANRVTSRTEDIAYCLMGIFSVNMPLLYGEGERAFLRLQEELIKHTDDQSLFAWGLHKDDFTGMLAESPSDFAQTGSVAPYHGGHSLTTFSSTNKGINIDVGMSHLMGKVYTATLNCVDLSDASSGDFVTIYLQQNTNNDRQYARCAHPRGNNYTLTSTDHRGTLQNVYVSQRDNKEPQSCLISLRRGPAPSGNHDFKLQTMFVSRESRFAAEAAGYPLVKDYIRRNRKISREWIPDGCSDVLFVHSTYGLSDMYKCWTLKFQSLSELTRMVLYVTIHFYYGKLAITAGMGEFSYVDKYSEAYIRDHLWTNDSESKSLVTIRKLDLPSDDFYVLDFDMNEKTMTWHTMPERRPYRIASNLVPWSERRFWAPADEALFPVYEVSAVAEPHGITEAQQRMIDERDYVTRLMKAKQMQLEDSKLEALYSESAELPA